MLPWRSSALAGRVAKRTRLHPTLPESLDLPFREAERYFSKKVSLTRGAFDELAAQTRVYAFTIARVTSIHLLEDFQDSILKQIIEGGGTFEEFQKTTMPELMARHGWSGSTPWHIETILRTQTQMAYGVGQLETLVRTASEFPFWQYVAINDSRTRPSHRALNGRIYPANHPFWRRHFPPWDYNCRCDVIPLLPEQVGGERIWTEDEPDETTFTGPGQLIELLEGKSPQQIARSMTLSLKAIHERQLMEELRTAKPLRG